MAKKRKTLDQYIEETFHFKDSTEFVIFVVWGLFVSMFLINLLK